MTKLVCVVMLMIAVVYGPAMAQEEARDLLEVNIFGGLGVPGSGISDWQTAGEDRGAKTGFDVGIDFAYFVTPSVLAGINFVYSQYSFDGMGDSDQKHRLYNPNLFVKYLFEGESYFVPFVKGHVGLYFPKFSTFVENPVQQRYRELSYDPAFGLGVGAGISYYTADFSALYVEANYHYAFSENVTKSYEGQEYTFGENLSLIDLHAGIRVLFGPE